MKQEQKDTDSSAEKFENGNAPPTPDRSEPSLGEIAVMTLKLLLLGGAIGLVIYLVDRYLS